MSRILIGVIVVLLLIIPWSERYSALDSFPHGHDVELSVLAFLALLGLALLFVRFGKAKLVSLLTFRSLLLSCLRFAVSLVSGCSHVRLLTDPHHPPLPGSSLDRFNLPLQI